MEDNDWGRIMTGVTQLRIMAGVTVWMIMTGVG